MDECMKNLSELSIEELETLIAVAQQVVQEKREEAKRQAELERQRQEELERQRQEELERQRQAELERQRQEELERQRQAELERQRQEQERLEAERRRQEEISALLKRLNELQSETYSNEPSATQEVQEEYISQSTSTSEAISPDESAYSEEDISQSTSTIEADSSDESVYSMVTCPKCHQLLPSDSRFCFKCGNKMDITSQATKQNEAFKNNIPPTNNGNQTIPGTKQNEAPKTNVPPTNNDNQTTQSQQAEPSKPIVYMNGSLKKWDTLPDEMDEMDWREIFLHKPKRLANSHLKITTKRILISHEAMMVASARSGLLMQAITSGHEHGKPWAMIPLASTKSFKQSDKNTIILDIGETVEFSLSRGKKYTSEVYETLKRIMPDKAL